MIENVQHLIDLAPWPAKIAQTLLIVGVVYLLQFLLRRWLVRLVTIPEVRLAYAGYLQVAALFIATALAAAVWVEELKTVAVLLAGLIAAALITGKEIILSMAGRLWLLAADHYRIGDRIVVNGVGGDVINIGLLHTWVMEVDERAGRQSTGRVILIPHLWLTQHAVCNLTLAHDFVWDEIEFTLPLTPNVKRLMEEMESEASRMLHENIEAAQLGLRHLEKRFAYRSAPATPIAYAALQTTSTGATLIRLSLRYTVAVRARRNVSSRLTLRLIELIHDHQRREAAPAEGDVPPP